MLEFSINGQIITRNDEDPIVRDSQNYVIAYFLGDEEWRSHGTVTAIFKGADGQIFNMILSYDSHYGHSCLVPWEVLTQPWFEVSAFCGNLITANTVKVFTIKSGYDSSRDSRIPTPDVYNQIIEKINESEVTITPTLQSGTKIADITKGGTTEPLYAPTGGGGGTTPIISASATVDGNTGTPSVTVTKSGTDEAPSFAFDFSNLKGETGSQGPTGPQGPQGEAGSVVTVTQTLSSGTKIAEIDVDGNSVDLFAPEGGGSASSLSDLSDTSISSPSSGDVLVYDGEKWENGVLEGFEREKVYTPVELTYDEGKYIQINTGVIASHASYHMAEISVTPGDKYRVAGSYNALSALYAFYDSNGNVIITYPTTQTADSTMEAIDILVPNNAVTLKISGMKLNGRLLLLYKATDGNSYKLLPINDILYGKKWFACGDSFTKGDFTGYVDSDGKTMYESDAFDQIDEKWKTYSYWISKRTHINSDNDTCAQGGMLFTNVTGAINPFSSDSSSINYTMIPSDCDYITLQFGLNEQSLTTEQIGTSADTTNETLWGAYYVVLNSILTNNPSVKIGIIISDGHMNQRYHDALIDIAKYWGIPYLDLKNGELVPMMNLGRLDACSEVAKNLRDSAFAISASNRHPTPVGHKYRSTVIENFLRTL